ncbi:hypothetical protein KAR91_04245 [Candidatus Pacearchaeota archaeon]|nr:hypothetical protein [Candidatus Pacearchaeota archaeon]
MTSADISFYNLVWKIIAGIFAAAWVSTPVLWSKVIKPFLEKWRYFRLRASRDVAGELNRLACNLGEFGNRLALIENELCQKTRRDLHKIELRIWYEALSYVAVYSNDDEERCSALRKLSQVETDGSILSAIDVVQGIASNDGTSQPVKDVALAALKELAGRQELKEQQPK